MPLIRAAGPLRYAAPCLGTLLCLASGWAAAARPDTAMTEPLPARNLAPVTWLYGLPRPLGAVVSPGDLRVSLIVEHSNNFVGESRRDLSVLFDGSTTVTTAALRGGFRERWEWSLEVPVVQQGGGFTDGFVEGYHDLFGFSNRGREAVPRNRLNYRVSEAGEDLVDVDSSGEHLGDTRLGVGWRLHQSRGREAVLRALVELPTGREKDLSGSGATDAAVWLEWVDHRWLEGIGTAVTLMGGVTVPGRGDLLADRQRDVVMSAHVGLHRPVGRRTVLRAQLDAHSDVIDSGVAPLGEAALLGTLGGSVWLSRALRLDLGVVEDLTPGRAPDVVFLLSLGARVR